MGRPVRIRWRKRRWLWPEPACPVGSFVEQDERVAAPRAKLATRACWWAIEQVRRKHASVNGLPRQLGTGWRTVGEAIMPLLQAARIAAWHLWVRQAAACPSVRTGVANRAVGTGTTRVQVFRHIGMPCHVFPSETTKQGQAKTVTAG